MEETKPPLWEEDLTKKSRKRKFIFRSAALHYLGLLMCIAGLLMTIMGYFNPDVRVHVIYPGSPNWTEVCWGLAFLLGGGTMFLFIEE
ncbi:MAG: hypothetical protein PHU53_01685 [Thermoplasmata archaeon]|nr:hypothetical protein [Thermoplasmata archaeon]